MYSKVTVKESFLELHPHPRIQRKAGRCLTHPKPTRKLVTEEKQFGEEEKSPRDRRLIRGEPGHVWRSWRAEAAVGHSLQEAEK